VSTRKPQSRPHWLLLIQSRSAFHAAPARHRHCFRHRHIPERTLGFNGVDNVLVKFDSQCDRCSRCCLSVDGWYPWLLIGVCFQELFASQLAVCHSRVVNTQTGSNPSNLSLDLMVITVDWPEYYTVVHGALVWSVINFTVLCPPWNCLWRLCVQERLKLA